MTKPKEKELNTYMFSCKPLIPFNQFIPFRKEKIQYFVISKFLYIRMTPAHEYLKQYFGYDTFRPLQLEAIAQIQAGNDVMLVMPTGGGKSVCFQLPSLLLKKTVVVVSPLIALMKDQVDGLRANGFIAAALNSSNSAVQDREVIDLCLSGKLNLLYLSPERLLSETSLLSQMDIGMFAIDEAHCISSWGHDFRPEYTRLKVLKDIFSGIPVMALTATADKITRKDIADQLGLVNPVTFIASFNRPNLSLNVRSGINSRDKYREIIRFTGRHPEESGIIYCLSRKETEKMADILLNAGVSCKYYHAGMDSESRQLVQDEFINDKIQVIVATIAFGLGINKPDVRWVIHNNLPKNIESYYQEIGRGGRDGLPAEAILFYSTGDLFMLRQFAEDSRQRELNLEKLQRMQHFAEADVCRRRILITYFGEPFEENCGNCDVCRNPREHFDGTILTQKAVSALLRMGDKAGSHMLIDVLRGSRKAEIIEKKFDKLKTYGAGADISYTGWQAYILQLLNLGVFEIAYDEGFTLRTTAYGRAIAHGEKHIQLVKTSAFDIVLSKHPKRGLVAPESEKYVTPKEHLRDLLRLLRRRLSVEDQVPPYIIFNDATLDDLVENQPADSFQLLDITGISTYKADKYGAAILEIIQAHKGTLQTYKGNTYLETFELLKKGLNPDQIAMHRKLSTTTVYSHMAYLILKGEKVDVFDFISREDLLRVREAFQAVGPSDKLKDYSDYLNAEVPYGKIRLALAYLQRNE